MKTFLKNKKKLIIVIEVILFVIVLIILGVYFMTKPKTNLKIGGQNVKIVTSGDGLYLDEYIDNRYIFKGANPNNYVKFNNELWRILSIDKDGNIEIIRNEILSNKSFDSEGVRASAGSYCENDEIACNAWAANSNLVSNSKKFVNGDFEGTVSKDSELLTYLNSEYLNKLGSKNIISHNWSVGGIAVSDNLNDQIQKENKFEWKGKVGLITVSDYVKASTGSNCIGLEKTNAKFADCREKNWMYIKDVNWWTVSPYEDSTIQVWYIGDGGYINNDSVNKEYGIRPVIYLSSNIKFNGEGTESNPYIIN